jgi:hypothetical protein
MKRLKLIIASITIAVFGVVALAPATTTYALDPLAICNNGGNADNAVCKNKSDDANKLIGTLVNTLLFVVGTLAVIMIIWAGIAYTISAGDAGKVTRAKNTLTYAIVGLIVAFLAYAIVNWVLKLFK